MTREDKLWTMKMQDLMGIADKLGIKIKAKSGKSKAIEMILAAEEMNKQNEKELKKEAEEPERLRKLREQRNDTESEALNATAEAVKKIEEPKLVPMPGTTDPDWGKKHYNKRTKKVESKRGALIEYDGKSQTITQWSKELNISVKTLYGRLYEMGWPVEKALTYKRNKKSE